MKKKLDQRNTIQLALMSILITISSFSFGQENEWKAPASAKQNKNPISADETSISQGKKTYEKECLSCHGKKGKGNGPSAIALEKPPGDLSSAKVQSQSDGDIFWKITEGKKLMPSEKTTLTEEQRWQVVNYVRTLKK